MFSPNIATAKRGESDAGIGMKHENNERELGLFSFHPINPVNAKKVTSNVSTYAWSTK